jgi:hypothetical protein
MTLIIQKPTGAKLNLAQTYVGIDDPDAAVYVAAVEAADGQSLETATKVAIHSFVKGCKNDGIWPAIKASCILAGARTLDGALVPLAGTAPTNVGGLFVSGDYNRKTGLAGDGSTKYLNSNRAGNADPQNNFHMSVYKTSQPSSVSGSTASSYIGHGGGGTGRSSLFSTNTFTVVSSANRSTANSGIAVSDNVTTTFIGTSRPVSANFSLRYAGTDYSYSIASQTSNSQSIFVFGRSAASANTLEFPANARLAFYSIGESLDLALLDARVTDLINAFAAAIP